MYGFFEGLESQYYYHQFYSLNQSKRYYYILILMNQKNNNCHYTSRDNHPSNPPTRRGISSFLLKTYSMVMVFYTTHFLVIQTLNLRIKYNDLRIKFWKITI
ncbi:unnamed protein product [Paramecium octaurelia]|uniref:Uncharacterized protein n=1 Tax=Paramecium octaurelia TaxID=43137 RepID=A0A8S1VYB1_PAROT|nr:unnamed protein product [Paramecium octaurelia]